MQSTASRSDIDFVIVYQREPHARQLAFADVEQPKNLGERCALARRTCDELMLAPAMVWVDGMDDQSRALFGDLPDPAIVIDANGVIRHKLPWAEPALLRPLVAQLLAASKAKAPQRPHEASAPEGDAWPALCRCATLALERPQDPHWRGWIDRLLASPSVPVRHWALQRLVEQLQRVDDAPALQAAQRQLAALRREEPWLLPAVSQPLRRMR